MSQVYFVFVFICISGATIKLFGGTAYDSAAGATPGGATVTDGIVEYLKRCLRAQLREETPAKVELVTRLPRDLASAKHVGDMKPAQAAFAVECAQLLQARSAMRRVAAAAKRDPERCSRRRTARWRRL